MGALHGAKGALHGGKEVHRGVVMVLQGEAGALQGAYLVEGAQGEVQIQGPVPVLEPVRLRQLAAPSAALPSSQHI